MASKEYLALYPTNSRFFSGNGGAYISRTRRARNRRNRIAGMITEVLAALSSDLPRAEDAAALSWKGLGAVYPRGYGTGYSHLGGVLLGLRRYIQSVYTLIPRPWS